MSDNSGTFAIAMLMLLIYLAIASLVINYALDVLDVFVRIADALEIISGEVK